MSQWWQIFDIWMKWVIRCRFLIGVKYCVTLCLPGLPVKKKKLGKNPDVDTSFLPDRDREVEKPAWRAHVYSYPTASEKSDILAFHSLIYILASVFVFSPKMKLNSTFSKLKIATFYIMTPLVCPVTNIVGNISTHESNSDIF